MAIKPAYVKNTANVLLQRYSDAFNTDFDRNKELVTELTNIRSKESETASLATSPTRKAGLPSNSLLALHRIFGER